MPDSTTSRRREGPGALGRALRRVIGPLFRRSPVGIRRAIRGARLQYLVRSGRFRSDEPEFDRMAEWLAPGDLALDIGANFGSYSLRMSELVGEAGRVYAFEPVPQTFAMLTRSLGARGCRNVCAMNLACSNANSRVTMSIPDDPLAGENLYQASISETGPSLTPVDCVRIDDLPLVLNGLRLVKIDAEGHDAAVIDGMWATLSREMPVLIVEHPPQSIIARLQQIGYAASRPSGSPNTVFVPPVIESENTE